MRLPQRKTPLIFFHKRHPELLYCLKIQARIGHRPKRICRAAIRKGDTMKLYRTPALFVLVFLTVSASAFAETARGFVFDDADKNGLRDAGEKGIPGVAVSNGEAVALTDAQGAWRLPVENDTALFVIKPSGWATPRHPEFRTPDFHYIHKPEGSPDLKYPGVAPTGPLPESIDFPLHKQEEPSEFRFIAMGDTQASNMEEVRFLIHDVFEELIGADAAFGITLGDLSNNTPALFAPLGAAIAKTGLPWYHAIGNHDSNYDAIDDVHADESWERVFGPPYYAFNYGNAHFLVLDNIHWDGEKNEYHGRFGEKQLAFVANVLKQVPEDRWIIPVMHIPLQDVADGRALLALLSDHPNTLSFSAHWHRHENYFFGAEAGWQGEKPHHHVVTVTACGNWLNGAFDEKGVPIAPMTDGAPNGYCFVDIRQDEYTITYKAAGEAADYQMHIFADDTVKAGETAEVLVNVFNGSRNTQVEMRLEGQKAWIPMEMTRRTDPFYQRNWDREEKLRKAIAKAHDREAPWEDTWKKIGRLYHIYMRPLSKPKEVMHLWRGKLTAHPEPGFHIVHARAKDMYGRTWKAHRIIQITE
jgi:hypothetical protein